MRGLFVSFEGPDGCGKSTQIAKLKEYCESEGLDVILTREPGGTPISEEIRKLILDPAHKEMADEAEALLYAAARAQHVSQRIKPALAEGKIVLCDRFMDSSIAYQAYGRQLGDGVRVINEFAVQGVMPDITFFLDLDPAEGKRRIMAAGSLDRLEQEAMDFHNRVYEGYGKIKELYPDRYVCIDASRSVDEVFEDIKKHFDERRS